MKVLVNQTMTFVLCCGQTRVKIQVWSAHGSYLVLERICALHMGKFVSKAPLRAIQARVFGQILFNKCLVRRFDNIVNFLEHMVFKEGNFMAIF